MSDLPTNSYDADELGRYQAVSTSAVLTLLLGLCSPIAFFSPVMILVPVFAIAVAVFALSKTSIAGGGLTGNRLARVGLALAIVCVVGSCTRIVVVNLLVNRHLEEQVTATPATEQSSLKHGL